jgi:hypothetical protein
MNKFTHMTIIFCAIISLIFINGWYRCRYNKGDDVLMTKLGIYDLDLWSICHFMLFAYIGYKFPDMFWPAMGYGVAWELWEQWAGDTRPSWLGGFGDCNLSITQTDSTHKAWWFGRGSDIAMNTAGFLVGIYMSRNKMGGYF